jgi:hypothetical protein
MNLVPKVLLKILRINLQNSDTLQKLLFYDLLWFVNQFF